MVICEFCLHMRDDGDCAFGLRLPKGMSCREFEPGIEKFCSNPNDFVSAAQILQMANYFGVKGTELKKVTAMVTIEARSRQAKPLTPVLDGPSE
ncbi:MAG TPA: hypothetical protein VJH03_17740 [Blastocatellia bacterium]|nr:hypothetical protein [Blastocatellia bacterium]